MKPNKPLIVHNANEENAGRVEEQIQIVQDHFKKMLPPGQIRGEDDNHFPPTKIRLPFSGPEMEKAVSSMANGKSTGID